MRKIQETLRLHFEAGLSYETVARSLKISKGSVFNTLERFKTAGLKWPLARRKEFNQINRGENR